jgi:DNA primase
MNVKIVLFPDGEDPDSFARKNRPAEVRDFIQQQSNDFITFKTTLLVGETANDPIKKAGLIKEIVGTISLIPDAIIRSVYIRECGGIMKISEQTLINELNKLRGKKAQQKSLEIAQEQEISEITEFSDDLQSVVNDISSESQEKGLICFMLNYGALSIKVDAEDEDGEKIITPIQVAEYIVMELNRDKINFQNKVLQSIFDEYSKLVNEGTVPDAQHFINHSDPAIKETAIELQINPNQLSPNWHKKHRISVNSEESDLKKSVLWYIYALKSKKVDIMITENLDALKNAKEEEEIILQNKHNALMRAKKDYAEKLTRIITR